MSKSSLAIIILSFLSITLFVTVLVLDKRPRDVRVAVEIVPKMICRDQSCQNIASDFADVMDTSVDPCEDFYNFSCGNWHVRHPANASYPISVNFERLQQKILDNLSTLLKWFLEFNDSSPMGLASFIYNECVEDSANERKEDLFELIQQFGGWPILSNPDSTPPADNLLNIFGYNMLAVQEFNLKIIFNFLVLPNPLAPDKFILTIAKSDLFTIYFTPPAIVDSGLLRGLVCQLNLECEKLSQLSQDISDVVALERDIQNIPKIFANSPSPNLDNYIREMALSLDTLNKEIPLPAGSWIDMMRFLLNDTNINGDFTLLVERPVVQRTFDILKTANIRTVKNWFMAKVLFELGPRLSSLFPRSTSNEHRCALEVNKLMPYATAAVYNLYWSKRGRKKKLVLEIVEEVKKIIVSKFNNSKWLDDDAKEKLNIKLKHLIPMVAYPDWILNEETLSNYYDIGNVDNETYIIISKALLRLEWVREAKQLQERFVRDTYWIRHDLINVNAWYNPFGNAITIPMSIMDYPVLPDDFQPRSVTFGMLGFTIAHEIFHAFDPIRIFFDQNGQLWNSPFSEKVINEYNSRLNCIMNQYSEERSNGSRTITEDFPDNVAIDTAYEMFERNGTLHDDLLPNFNQSQSKQFFISYASTMCVDVLPPMIDFMVNNGVHSFGTYRVKIPLRNSNWFAKAFQCKEGSKMNPPRKCSIF